MSNVGDVVGGLTIVTAEGIPEKTGDEEPVGPTYRIITAKDEFPSIPGVTTLYESLERSVRMNPSCPALGWRPIDAEGKAGDYEWITYSELESKVKAVGSAVVACGVKPQGKVGIFSGNTMQYMMALQAGNYYNTVVVPIYDSLGENAVEYIVNHAGVELIYLDVAKLPAYVKVINEIKQKTKAVVYWGSGEPKSEDVTTLKKANVPLYSWDQFVELGTSKPADPVPPTETDTCTIMYTSGTTGDPKGVEITHKNIVSGIAAIAQYTEYIGIDVSTEDSTLSYLPLAHIFDRVVEEFALYAGARIGYYQGNVKKIVDDVAALRPTLFIAVPRVLERIQSGIAGKIGGQGAVAKLLFGLAYKIKQMRLWMGSSVEGAAPLLDNIVFSAIKKGFGGRLRFVVSGGAPLGSSVQEFLQIVLCCPILQGYGLTETCAASFFTHPPPRRHTGTVGPPLPATEFRFQAVPEMKYDPYGEVPQGEILLRGPMVFAGYYKMADKTKESFDADGFFHTGDIGELTPDGCLRIIDRLKNLFKLSQGEYIAVEKLEGDYADTEVVEQIWIYGTSTESFLVAVVVPDKHKLEAWASENSVSGSFEDIVKSDQAKEYVLAELSKTSKGKRLKGFEAIRGVILRTEGFSVDDDTMTPSMKLKRPQLSKMYKKQIDDLYKQVNAKLNARG